MHDQTTYSGIVGEWQRLLAALEANGDEIPHLQASSALLANLLSQTQAVLQQQAALVAEKQQSSQDVKTRIGDGQRLATMLRQGLKQYYGIRSEKLAEFGIAPFRGRSGRTQPENPAPAADRDGGPLRRLAQLRRPLVARGGESLGRRS